MSKKLRNQKASRANRYLDHYMNMPPGMDYLPYRFGAGTYARLTFRMEQTERRNSPRLASQDAADPECGWYRITGDEAEPDGPNLSWCHAPAGHSEPYHLSTYAERVPEDDPRLRSTG